MYNYNTWKDNLTADNWEMFYVRGLQTEVYGRIAECHDTEGATYYEREFMYKDRIIDEYDLDSIIRKAVRIPAVKMRNSNNLSILDLPAA